MCCNLWGCKESDMTERLNCLSGTALYELLVYFGNSLSVVSFAVIFSKNLFCLFTVFVVSFVVQNFQV